MPTPCPNPIHIHPTWVQSIPTNSGPTAPRHAKGPNPGINFSMLKKGKPDESYDQSRVLSDFLILKALSISEIEGAVNHFGRLERKLSESLGIWYREAEEYFIFISSKGPSMHCISIKRELSFANCQHCFQRRECRRHAACWNGTIRASLSCHGVLHHKEIQTLHKD